MLKGELEQKIYHRKNGGSKRWEDVIRRDRMQADVMECEKRE